MWSVACQKARSSRISGFGTDAMRCASAATLDINPMANEGKTEKPNRPATKHVPQGVTGMSRIGSVRVVQTAANTANTAVAANSVRSVVCVRIVAIKTLYQRLRRQSLRVHGHWSLVIGHWHLVIGHSFVIRIFSPWHNLPIDSGREIVYTICHDKRTHHPRQS